MNTKRSFLAAVLAALSVLPVYGVVHASPARAAVPTTPTRVTVFSGEIESLSVVDPADHWSAGRITVGGQRIILPRNLLIDLPANRLTVQEIFAQAPAACVALAQSGLAEADTCTATPGRGGYASISANRTPFGDIIAGDVFIQKGLEVKNGTVTFIDFTNGFFRLDGTLNGDAGGAMVRLNDPNGRHTVQQGPGCPAGTGLAVPSNCSADPRFTLDRDNYTSVFTTGYPLCIPSTLPRPIPLALQVAGGATGAAGPDGSGDALCPDTNRPVGTLVVGDSRRFAPIQVGDHIEVRGNFETVGATRFLSSWFTRVSRALQTSAAPGQPDYTFLDSMFVDAPAFQRQRVRDLFLGMTTEVVPDVDIFSRHFDPGTNQVHEFPLGTVTGCDIAGGVGSCSQVLGPNTFRVRHDVDFAAGAGPKLNPCIQLRANPRFAARNLCPNGGTQEEMLSVLSPVSHEVQLFTGRKEDDAANPAGPTLFSFDVRGGDTPNGQYVFPMGINLGGIEALNPFELNIDAISQPYFFSGIPWNLDRRLSPNGCNGPCEATPQPLDPFPFEGADPRTLSNVPHGAVTDPNFTASPLTDAANRILSFVDPALFNFNGDATVLAWPPATPGPQPQPAVITGTTPAAGNVGDPVTITGSGFIGATKVVFFNQVPATTFTVVSDTQIDTVVPVGAVPGPVQITTPEGTATSPSSYGVGLSRGGSGSSGGADTTPPSTPTGVTAAALNASQIDVSWNASTDDVGVASYWVYRDGDTVPLIGVPTTSISDTGLDPSSTHSYRVAAVDFAGNVSGLSDAAGAATPAAPPAVALPSPDAVTFVDQPVGTTSLAKGVAIHNVSAVSTMHVTDVKVNGDGYSIVASSCDPLPRTLTPGTNCTVGVAFTPTHLGAHLGSVVFTHDGEGGSTTVPLSGNALAPVPAAVDPVAVTPGSASSPVSFATLAVKGERQSETISVYNTGSTGVTFGNVGKSGDRASNFTVSADTCSGQTVAAFGLCTLEVVFDPSSKGPLSATLGLPRVGTSAVVTVALQGTGK